MTIKNFSIIILLISAFNIKAQEREKDTLDDQVVNVIKPYTPTISDAFKIKEVPQLTDTTEVQKKDVKYNIFSIPVASTFTPAKGKAASVDKAKPVKLYDNYASLGAGNFTHILGELYVNHNINNTESVGAHFSHHSSQGGIDEVLLNDEFYKTSIYAHYSQKLRDLSWKVFAGANLQTYNWYGLPNNLFNQETINSIDPTHTFLGFNAGGRIHFENTFISDADVLFRRFSDDNDSGENRFIANANFNIPVLKEGITTKLSIDYLAGSFDRNYFTEDVIDYSNFQIGLAPSYRLIKDDLRVDIGLQIVYFNDNELSENEFFIYPNIEASYRLVDELLIAFGGIKGGLHQNSYYGFATENPFVSPTLAITPTDQEYLGFIGLKGKLSSNVSYNLKASYTSEENKPLFIFNPAIANNATENYQFGNSFGIVYDDVTTFGIAGELTFDVNRNFSLGIKGDYFNYDADVQAETWNLPDITGSIFMDYQISDQWFAGGSVFFMGERKDQITITGLNLPNINLANDSVTLDSFFDANVHLGYRINDRFSVLGKVNNIAGENYERWANFPVQGIQFVVGATYQFDF